MATQAQSNYIHDLAVLMTKEFKEVKELLVAKGIVKQGTEIVGGAQTLAEIVNALTDAQASQLIDALITTKAPTRSRSYSQKRVSQTVAKLDAVKSTISEWSFL